MIQCKSSIKGRTGLTLMELIVVLTILVAVAAIAVPMFPNLLRRSHKATDATQTNEVCKAVQLYQALDLSYPDQFDLMVDSTGIFPTYVPGRNAGGTAAFGLAAKVAALDTEAPGATSALAKVGIVNGWTLATSTTEPTLNPYTATVPTPLTTSSQVAFVDITQTNIPAELKRMVQADPTAKFVVFGVGQRCSMIGTVLQNAPISVPQNGSFTPANTYSRVGVIFLVAGTEVTRTERARFIGAVALEDDELESTEKDLVGYYEVTGSGG